MTREQKIRLRRIAMPGLVVLAMMPVALTHVSRSDARHASFYNTGATINAFLKTYCKGVETAFASQNPDPVLEAFSSAYRSPGRGRWLASETPAGGRPVAGEATQTDLTIVGDDDFDRPALAQAVQNYLGGLSAIERTVCKIDLIEDTDLKTSAVLSVKFILDGIDREDRLFQDRHFYRWHLVNEGEGKAFDWKITRDELIEGTRIAGRGDGLVATDPERLGIDYRHHRNPHVDMKTFRAELKFGVVQHAAGGVSAADYDLDGRPDLLFLDGVDSRLYRNEGLDAEGLPAFRDVTEEAGLDGLDRAHVGIFADYDNDGDRDLFVGRYLAPNRFYRNRGDGTFVDEAPQVGLDASMPTMAATLLDFDRDGFLDLYLAVNGNAFEELPRLPFFARNGLPNRLYRNQGGERFVDVTKESGTGDTGWSLAVAAGDYDGDGLTDLAVANDFGRKSLYRNEGDGTFSDRAKHAGVLDFGPGMGLAFADYNDDGRLDLYTSNVNSNQRWYGEDMTVKQYLRNVMRTRWILADAGEYLEVYRLLGEDWVELGQQFGEGNSLFRNDGDGVFTELKESHTGRTGWGWSVNFLDVDNDTDLDLYAANGWISNTPGTDL